MNGNKHIIKGLVGAHVLAVETQSGDMYTGVLESAGENTATIKTDADTRYGKIVARADQIWPCGTDAPQVIKNNHFGG